MQGEVDQLKEGLRKINNRNSDNSSKPPSADSHKKKNKDVKKRKKKQRPQYGHEGKTRNGFGSVDHTKWLAFERCPQCGNAVTAVPDASVRADQIAELVEKPVEVREYQRPKFKCPVCGWQGYADLALGCREDFSYGVLLSSLVGWLGYDGHLSWAKQRFM